MKSKIIRTAFLAALSSAALMTAQTAFAAAPEWDDTQLMPLLDALEIMQGDGMGNYGLDRYVSREEMAKIAVNASSHKDETAVGLNISSFSDVNGYGWSAPYIQNGTKNGIIKGYLDGTFRPYNTVNFEEATTMLLKVLGYTDDNFGVSYPYGQVNFAKNIDLLDGINATYGEPMTRAQIARMVYNALDTNMANSNAKLISVFDAAFTEDVTIIATPDEDNTLGTGKVSTSAGKYNMYEGFDKGNLGLRGDMVVKNGKDMLCFVPDGTLRGKSYNVDAVIGSDLELDGTMLDLDANTTVYYKSGTYSYANVLKKASKGDTFKVYYDTNGAIEHCVLVPALNVDINTNALDRYVIYSVLNNTVIGYKNGVMSEVSLKDTTSCYKETTAYSYASVRNEMEMGDVLKVKYKSDGEVDYVIYESGNMEGPIKISSAADVSRFVTNDATQVMRDGNKTTKSALQANDIVYYSKDLNMLLAYSTKVSGVYQSASPSRDNPTSVTVSGKTYAVEGVEAYNDLSSSGAFKYGDTVTLCLGKDGKSVAGVVTTKGATAGTQTGYVTAAGKKNFTNNDGTSYSSYYVKLVSAQGVEYEYEVNTKADSFVGYVVNIKLNQNGSTIGSVPSSSAAALTGTVNAANMTIGTNRIAEDCAILDTASSNSAEYPTYKRVFLQRLDGMTLKSSNVRYYKKNSVGEVSEIILNDLTGDCYKYGMTTSVEGKSGVYRFDIGGAEMVSMGSYHSDVAVGIPARVRVYGNTTVPAGSLKRTGTISALTQTTAYIGNTEYKLSDEVAVYEDTGIMRYNLISINDAINGNYSLSAYSDKPEEQGGRIRVIIAKTK